MVAQCRPLIDVLAEIPEFRHARGKRHPLPAILGLICVAVLCGYRSYSAIAQWARIYPRDLVEALGFTHPTPPCPATLRTALRQVDRAHVEAVPVACAEPGLAAVPADPSYPEAS